MIQAVHTLASHKFALILLGLVTAPLCNVVEVCSDIQAFYFFIVFCCCQPRLLATCQLFCVEFLACMGIGGVRLCKTFLATILIRASQGAMSAQCNCTIGALHRRVYIVLIIHCTHLLNLQQEL